MLARDWIMHYNASSRVERRSEQMSNDNAAAYFIDRHVRDGRGGGLRSSMIGGL